MILFVLTPLLIGLASCFILQDDTCPVGNPCYCATIIHCDRRGLTRLPTFTASKQHFFILDLSHNSLNYIPPHAFRGVNMTTLDIGNNPIVLNMDDDAFDGIQSVLEQLIIPNTLVTSLPASMGSLHRLRTLHLDNSLLTTVDDSILRRLRYNLQELSLASLKLTAWPQALNYMAVLRVLDLSGNNIQTIPNDAFVSFASTLQILKLDNCNLTIFPVGIGGLRSLKELHLSGNRFETVPVDAFNGVVNSLIILNLTNTGLNEVPSAIGSLRSLSELYLGYNHITASRVRNGVFSQLQKTLTVLHLDHGYINHIPAAFSDLHVVQQLDLTGNRIHVLENYDFGTLTSLRTLILNNNLITNIKHAAFSGLTQLEQLLARNCSMKYVPSASLSLPANLSMVDLSYNKISVLLDNSFPDMKSLKTLKLTGNHLMNISLIAFQDVPNLDLLYMNDCGLHTVPKAVEYAPNLSYVELYDNNITCNCDLKWIWAWKVAHGLIPHLQSVCHGPNDDLDMYVRYDLRHCP